MIIVHSLLAHNWSEASRQGRELVCLTAHVSGGKEQ